MQKTYSVITYGCQMNISDSERVEAVCRQMGYKKAKESNSVTKDSNVDLYIINTCSIRQKAEDRVVGMGGRFKRMKRINPNTKVILTGCMAVRDNRQLGKKNSENQEKHINSLKKLMPWVDHILPINQIHTLPELLGEVVTESTEEYFAVTPEYNSSFQAYVPISTGCDKFCTYCIVPFTRGKEVHRPFEQIYKEIKDLVDMEYKEITLLGQNVNSWKLSDNESQKDFAYLMEKLAQIKGDYWLRFMSSHPYDINPRLIDVIAQHSTITKQVHFAMQSGSNSVLKRMNRHYNIESFKEQVYRIRERIPGVAVTTDIITGFCGETDSEFNETAKVMEELRFDMAYISEYSQRGGTLASKFYKDDVDNGVKAERKLILDKILKRGVVENNEKMVGTKQKVLLYKDKIKNKRGVFGKSNNGKDVLIQNLDNLTDKIKLGDFIGVKITGYRNFCLEGEL